MLTGKPVISFAYDYDHYANTERGLFYDLEHVFPGPVCKTFDELANSLEGVFDKSVELDEEMYALKRRVFFDHVDANNSWRVVKKVKTLYISDDLERATGEIA
jgi:CDP-glycerol glycerophosphotransferase (TagB/SpsB family)